MATQFAEPSTRRRAKRTNKPKPVEAVAPPRSNRLPVSLDAIRLRAYLMWVGAGKLPGDGVNFWLEAEQQLLNRNQSAHEEFPSSGREVGAK